MICVIRIIPDARSEIYKRDDGEIHLMPYEIIIISRFMREKSAFYRCQRMMFVEHDVIICKRREKKLELTWSDPWKGPICLGGINEFRYHPLVQQFSKSPFLSPGTGRLKLPRDRDFPFTIVPVPGPPATYTVSVLQVARTLRTIVDELFQRKKISKSDI
jgi:hypothetical protein